VVKILILKNFKFENDGFTTLEPYLFSKECELRRSEENKMVRDMNFIFI
jgi:hypothetical protein